MRSPHRPHGLRNGERPVDGAAAPGDTGFLLSVIIPVYNEADTIVTLLEKVRAAQYRKQIIIVDDASTDGTAALVEAWRANFDDARTQVELLAHRSNRGKGAAIRTGLNVAKGEVTLIQDADLEYDPEDYPELMEPIRRGKADVVYGSRYLQRDNYLPWTLNRVCVHLLNWLVHLLYRQRITDEATCYKVFRTELLTRLALQCERFEFCPEVTAKLCRCRVPIHEVPIRYHPRFATEGKKIRWRDGIEAIWTLFRWRFKRWRISRRSTTEPTRSRHEPADTQMETARAKDTPIASVNTP